MTNLIARALEFSSHHHRDQEDKNGLPYIWHPVRVAQGIRLAGFNEHCQATGLLHDTVEDTEATLEMIRKEFGDIVWGGVDAMTRRGHFTKDFLEHPESAVVLQPEWVWDETYKEYIPRCADHPIGRVVKRFDVYDNADPKRYCEGVPAGRYIWTLDYLNDLDRADHSREWEARLRGT